jgi:chitin synthase
MMYAMCNLHDVTWGTKGDNGAVKDLGGAKKVKGDDGKEFMEVEIPTAREDVDQLWAASRAALKQKPPEEKQRRDAATKQTDQDRNSRTNVVLVWVGSNMYVPINIPRGLNYLITFLILPQAHDYLLHIECLFYLGTVSCHNSWWFGF